MFTFIKLFICENESLKVLNGNLPKNYVISMQELVDHRSFLPYPAYSTQCFVIIIHLSSSVNHTIFITCMCSQTSPLMSPSSSSSLPSNPLCFSPNQLIIICSWTARNFCHPSSPNSPIFPCLGSVSWCAAVQRLFSVLNR